MTPTETATILRQFNEWRRGDEDIPQFDVYKVDAAIDAAVEMIERLEAAEKSDAESIAMYRKARDERDALRAAVRHEADCVEAAKAEIAALRAKIEAMEKQEPVGTLHDDGCFVWRETAPHQSNYAGWKMALYALPGAQPAPSVPEGWQLVPTAESRHPGIYKMLGALHAADNTPGMSEWESYRAMLAAAPEAKP